MPQETPLAIWARQTGAPAKWRSYLAIIYLDTDAARFWGIIRRHVMRHWRMGIKDPLMDTTGFNPIFPGILEDEPEKNIWGAFPDFLDDVPEQNISGTFIWEQGFGSHGIWGHGYWSGARIAWETIAPARLRVVVAVSSDLLPNLLAAYDVLAAIFEVFPESRAQLPDIAGLVESWAYDQDIAAMFHAQLVRWGHTPAAIAVAVRGAGPALLPLGDMPPPVRTKGYTWDDVFDWWYRGGRTRFPELKDMTKVLGMAAGTIHNNHTNYRARYGRAPIPDDESRIAREMSEVK